MRKPDKIEILIVALSMLGVYAQCRAMKIDKEIWVLVEEKEKIYRRMIKCLLLFVGMQFAFMIYLYCYYLLS